MFAFSKNNHLLLSDFLFRFVSIGKGLVSSLSPLLHYISTVLWVSFKSVRGHARLAPRVHAKNYTRNEWRRCENYTRNEWRRCETTLETSGDDVKLHSKRVYFSPINTQSQRCFFLQSFHLGCEFCPYVVVLAAGVAAHREGQDHTNIHCIGAALKAIVNGGEQGWKIEKTHKRLKTRK
jgi:hypothetical protein